MFYFLIRKMAARFVLQPLKLHNFFKVLYDNWIYFMSTIFNRLFQFDQKLRKKHGAVIVGIDEAGRGAMAGPLSAGAVILPPDAQIDGVNDSKKMTAESRTIALVKIKEIALGWGFHIVSPEDIDEKGLTYANGYAMLMAAKKAIDMAYPLGSPSKPFYIIDQFNQKETSPASELLPFLMKSKMDGTSLSVAAASVIAKSMRDEIMVELAQSYPLYGLESHKGYINSDHVSAVIAHGRVKGLHRMSYQIEGVNKPRQLKMTDFFKEGDSDVATP